MARQIDEYWCPRSMMRHVGHPERPSEERLLELEHAAQARFGIERAPTDLFIGRISELEKIADFIRREGSQGIMVVHGPAGVGKTAFLARAVQQASDAGLAPIVRYLGVTPQSSNVRGLLSSLCRELSQENQNDYLPTDLRELQEELHAPAIGGTGAPVVLFLDALEQLDEANGGRELLWLRMPLPPRVKVVISCVSPDDAHDPLGEPFRALGRRRLLDRAIMLESLSPDEALTLLKTWLDRASPRRTLTDAQHAIIAQLICPPANVACRQPLFLHIFSRNAVSGPPSSASRRRMSVAILPNF